MINLTLFIWINLNWIELIPLFLCFSGGGAWRLGKCFNLSEGFEEIPPILNISEDWPKKHPLIQTAKIPPFHAGNVLLWTLYTSGGGGGQHQRIMVILHVAFYDHEPGPDLELWGPLGRLSCGAPYNMLIDFHESDYALFRSKWRSPGQWSSPPPPPELQLNLLFFVSLFKQF